MTSQFSVSLTCCGSRSSLLIERLLVGRNSLAFLDAEDGRVLGLVHVLDVPGKRARLGEPITTSLTREEPDIGMSHVMVNQTCALRELLVADGAIWHVEQALEMRLLGLAAHDRDAELLIALDGYAFETRIVFAARDWRLGYRFCMSSSLPVCTFR